jgi:uncharacterized protein YbjT (DUF2867 family)
VHEAVSADLRSNANVRPRVAVAGASGFVGRALIDNLARDCDVIALARSARGAAEGDPVTWRACDLFHLGETEEAVAGADSAFYLVHSMMPTSRLTQGSFDDMDLICADNFARAAKTCGIRHIVYLGGLLHGSEDELSRHLESRLEVEQTLAAHGASVTTLRAGMIVGAGGSSFRLMMRLVKRLPVMVGPRWMRSRTQAIALADVVQLLRYALDHPELAGTAYDVGCDEVMTYAEMLRMMAEVLGKNPPILTLPVATANLSLMWVSVVTGASRALVRPLVDSLKHDMVARDGLVLQKRAGLEPTPLRRALADAVLHDEERPTAAPKTGAQGDSRVRSVQRLPLPANRDAAWVADEYARWLPTFFRPFLRVDVDESKTCRFYFRPLRSPLLVLAFAPTRSSADRQLFRVTGGLLARRSTGAGRHQPRLEFRSVLDRKWVLAAIHDFSPSLPWVIYKFTQALVHLWVMHAFGRHLGRLRDVGMRDADLSGDRAP